MLIRQDSLVGWKSAIDSIITSVRLWILLLLLLIVSSIETLVKAI